jgi:YfiH family protein
LSQPSFLHSDLLTRLAVEHGFGTRASPAWIPPGVLLARQVHGARALWVPPYAGEEADALATREPGIGVGVYTADCVPILLVDPETRMVAAVHAGWRGSARAVAEVGVRALVDSGARAAGLIAAIGPHIGPCCYEVDAPVRDAIATDAAFRPSPRRGHWQLDLYELNRRQLVHAGLDPRRVERVGGCTACNAHLYASHRRDGSGERMLHYVRVPAPSAA